MRQSSISAHQSIKPRKENHYKEIKETMRKLKVPHTSRAIGYHCPNIDYHEAARRLSEMRDAGMVREFGIQENMKYKPILWELA